MTTTRRALQLPLAAALAGLLLACASTTAQPPAAAPLPPAAGEPTAATLFPPIKAFIGEARCTADAQCRTIGVGHKACGGPAGYLAWSTQGTDEKALRAAVERQARAEQVEQERSGMQSNCMLVPDPGARCVVTEGVGRCQPNPRGAGGTAAGAR